MRLFHIPSRMTMKLTNLSQPNGPWNQDVSPATGSEAFNIQTTTSSNYPPPDTFLPNAVGRREYFSSRRLSWNFASHSLYPMYA